MQNKSYISGSPNRKSDFHIEYKPASTGALDIKIYSKTMNLHGSKLKAIATSTISFFNIKHGIFSITDNGGQYFVLQARLEAAIKSANSKINNFFLNPINKKTLYKTTKKRFRRSRLYIPGNQPKLMLNAGIHEPDGIILDLEDSIEQSEKISARYIVRNALRTIDFFGSEHMVRINQGDLGIEDLHAIIPENVHVILIPKVETKNDITSIDKLINKISKQCNKTEPTLLLPIIESAKGILNSFEIAKASKNIIGLAIGLEDYTADLGVKRTNTGKESLFARSQLVQAAKATGIQAIDTVFSDVSDELGLRESVREAKGIGFEGKGCIHPRQIKPIHEEFTPTIKEIDEAKNIVKAFNHATSKGIGVISLGSKMIDPPVVERAQHTTKLAISMNLLDKDWELNEK